MLRAHGIALFGASFLLTIPGVRAETEAGVIAAAVVAGLLLLAVVIGVAIFCVYRNGGCKLKEEKPKRNRSHKKHKRRHNGGYPPPPYQLDSRYLQKANGFVHAAPVAPMPPPPLRPAMYPTYHGPPPEFVEAHNTGYGTKNRPPTIVIPASFGTVTMRPDPRPVIKTRQYKQKDGSRDERHQHRSKSYDRSRDKAKQEFVIQQSYDGIPVIRPVIYVDEDSKKERHRSKSKSRSKSRERPEHSKPKHSNVTTIPLETQKAEVHVSDREELPVAETHENTRPKTPTSPPKVSPERSRASSVTEGLRALHKSFKDHIGDDSDSDSSNAPSFNWAKTDRAPEPRAGDVMFFPAGATTNTDTKKPDEKEQVYGYTKVIKQSIKESPPKASVMIQEPEKPSTGEHPDLVNGGYEVPQSSKDSLRRSAYETELSQTTRNYNDIGASMSDRLQSLVEDGDKTRFSRYNVGAVNFEDEGGKTEEDEEPVQMRVRERPVTPPADFPRDSFHSEVSARPKTPPRDIPLITPRESTEIPPLDLQSSVNSPSDYRQLLRPVTPPRDFPVSPTRPKTPPTDFHTPRPPTPPRDIDTNRSEITSNNLNVSVRSQPVDPNTGAPGSFQARQRLIEAHLMRNVSPEKTSNEQSNRKTEVLQRGVSSVPVEAPSTVHVPPGAVPPPPPPPPLPK